MKLVRRCPKCGTEQELDPDAIRRGTWQRRCEQCEPRARPQEEGKEIEDAAVR